jgi:hypothetical protein
MRRSAVAAVAVATSVCLNVCVDTAAIKNFANEGSVISSDSAIMGSDAAFASAKPYLTSAELKQIFLML